ncbi:MULTISPECIES: protein translocase subunit SecD [unclassified Candidatus Frackibacter]|uniref:protein translocase subunit SecD n=1 Tax=unclassified Candidatus Frackibacter TaxID=2648818 RepID=UPI000796BB47|nr:MULTISPECIES: protein translocase subunit SecD [unclassified Candidatus Frackibacter]KXS44183.1 MAG: preprotein translocase subunit SecD [Candidatus Frackibacter sp. T328-2]SDC64226.1 preprotein translocase subunit SecD [Candidatus Frackibacter sp. WG11]SEM77653.1 preprotein translocase subunit SecD [Candidatus Frackibacter sp. WG12]SFL88444.1 preprotein translocase subunit SecD [Candidatus Frackibacter sp. WG13]
MTRSQKRTFKLIGIVVLLAAAVYFLFPINQSINLGLDLQGGTHVVLEAQETPESPVTNDAMRRVTSVISRRVNQMGLTEPVIQRQGDKRIIVELPGIKNPNQAINTIGKTAQLKFKNPAGEVVMTGETLIDAQADYGGQFGRPVIRFRLNDEGADKFAKLTKKYVGQRIAIYLDNDLLTNPMVQNPITGGQGIITGYKTLEEAQKDALLLRAGALPVPVKVIENRTVGPTLGKISINKSINAGAIGLVLVALLMIILYRVSGLIATLALGIYGIIVLGTLAGLGATLTLPGIAGLILSVGMAVDANIIIFERIKEELGQGKTTRAAIRAGFERAFKTILDSNVTTLITAAILAYFGTGTVRGFAITLSIGILASMFTAIVVTRTIIDLALDANLLKGQSSFGRARR